MQHRCLLYAQLSVFIEECGFFSSLRFDVHLGKMMIMSKRMIHVISHNVYKTPKGEKGYLNILKELG